jgi:5-hydroxyisourate hydrolase-like protein (transthyretin family)
VSKLLQVNLSQTTGAKVYPNPVKTLLNVVVPADVIEVTYKLIDADGKIALKGAATNQSGTVQIPVTSVASGIYFLQVTTGNKVQTYEVEVRQ